MKKPVRVSGQPSPRSERGSGLRRALIFAVNFVKHPRMVGTFAVSSPAVVQRLLAGIDWSRCRRVVELGPGVGTITEALLAAMPEDGRLAALEMNADFVAALRKDFPDPRLEVVHGSAAEVDRHLAAIDFGPADLVISGIPFSTMPPAVRDQTLDRVAACLAGDGRFLVYQYANHVLKPLQQRFERVEREQEWRNLVPVRLFRCSHPRSSVSAIAS